METTNRPSNPVESMGTLKVKTAIESVSDDESLNLDEELAVLALLNEEAEESHSSPPLAESSVGSLSGDEDLDEAALYQSLISDLRVGDENRAVDSITGPIPDPDTSTDCPQGIQKVDSTQNFEEDIAFFDQLGADQDKIQEHGEVPVFENTVVKEQDPNQLPLVSLGPPSTTTENMETPFEVSSLPGARQEAQGYGILPVESTSFAPIGGFDPGFQSTHQMEQWYTYNNNLEVNQTGAVLLAEESNEGMSQRVEVYPRQSQGRPPCSLLVFGLGGHCFSVFNGGNSIEKSKFLDLPVFLKNRNQSTTGFSSAFNEGGSGLNDPAIEHNIGPLNPSTNREKVLKFLSDQMEITSSQPSEHNSTTVHELSLIWTTLALLARNRGSLTVKTPEGEVTDPDVIEMLTVKNSNTLGSTLSPGGLPGLKDMQTRNQFEQQHLIGQIQQSLLYGRQQEALELATSGGLWSLALALSQSLGPQISSQTLEQMTQSLLYDSPLKTHLLLLAGKTKSSTEQGLEAMNSTPAVVQGNEMVNVFTPDSDPSLSDWRSTLAILVANRLPGFQDRMTDLGDKLWQQRHEIYAAHLCYLLAAVVPQNFSMEEDCRMVLLGADHKSCPDGFFTVEALQRTEVLEWILMSGKLNRRLISLVPYKLHFARLLSECGKISEAIQYAEVVVDTMKSISSRSRKDLSFYKRQSLDLLSQLRTFAESFNINVERQTTLFKKMGDLIDRGVNKLFGVTELEDDAYRTAASSDGVAFSDVHSFKKSSSLASLGSSTTGGSVTFSSSQAVHSPAPAAQSWFHRMLGRPALTTPPNTKDGTPAKAVVEEEMDVGRQTSQWSPVIPKQDTSLEFEEIKL